jgi:hypothetical protein
MTFKQYEDDLYDHYMALENTLDKLLGAEFIANRTENQAKQDVLRTAIRHINTAMGEIREAGLTLLKGE